MGLQVSALRKKVRALADARKGGREHLMSLSLQGLANPLPALAAVPNLGMEAACKWQASLLDTDNHTIRANEMLDAGRGETCFVHPGDAISAGIVKSSGVSISMLRLIRRPNAFFPTIVVDNGIVDDNRTALWKRGERLGEQELLSCKIPIVQDVTHHDDIGTREFVFKKVARLEPYPIRQPPSRPQTPRMPAELEKDRNRSR